MNYQKIIDAALAKGISEIELYVQNSTGATFRLFKGELDTYNKRDYFGMALRGLYNGKMGYAYTESLEDIDFILNELIKNAKLLTSTEKEIIFDGKGTYQEVPESKADYQEYDNLEKISMLKKFESDILSSNSKIKTVSYCLYQENETNTKIINSKGLDLERNFSYGMLLGGAVAEENGETADGFARDISYKLKGFEFDRMVKEIVEEATGTLGAQSIQTGNYSVVLKNSVMTDILQAFSSLFSGESALKKLTSLREKIGKKVFGDNITIHDNPFYSKAAIKIPFDDEGVPCFEKTIVENGIFKTFLHNLATADYFQTKSTGNGFKASIASSIHVSPTNLYLQPDNHTREELLSSLEKGIYVTSVTGLHAGINPISGSFNIQSKGYYIENGQIVRPITLFVLSGNFFEMLNEVEMIANDLEDHFLEVAAPSIKVKTLKVSGK